MQRQAITPWKTDRVGPGLGALAGLQHLTEDRLQQMITDSYDAVKERRDNALKRFAAIDSEAAELLRVLRNELLDALPPGALLNPDAAELLYSASRNLRNLEDSAALLATAARKLSGIEGSAENLANAASDLRNLPDYVHELERVVEKMRRYRPEC